MVFGVPPEMVAAAVAGQSVTYSNIETKPLALLKFGVGPWLVGLQAGLDDLLPGGIVGRFDPAGLLRADLKTRCESYQIAIDGGWLTVDEVRARRVGAAGSGRPAAFGGRVMTVLTREFTAALQVRDDGDGCTIVGVAVPYGVEASIGSYVEVFTRGAFADAGAHPRTVTHPRDGGQLPIGHSIELRDAPDGVARRLAGERHPTGQRGARPAPRRCAAGAVHRLHRRPQPVERDTHPGRAAVRRPGPRGGRQGGCLRRCRRHRGARRRRWPAATAPGPEACMTTGGPVHAKANKAIVAEERVWCYRKRLNGHSEREIAALTVAAVAAGEPARALSQTTVHRRIQVEIDAAVTPLAVAARQTELDRLDNLAQRVLKVIETRHFVTQYGEFVIDEETGQRLLDDAAVLRGVDRLLHIAERRAKLLGLVAPRQLDAAVSVRYTINGVDMNDLR